MADFEDCNLIKIEITEGKLYSSLGGSFKNSIITKAISVVINKTKNLIV